MKTANMLLIASLIAVLVSLISIHPDGAEALMKMSTRNNAVDIEVNMEYNIIVCITTPCPTDQLTLKFFKPATDELLQHVNYCFSIMPEGMSEPSAKTCDHSHDGTAAHPVELPDTGSFTFEVNIEGLGIDKPYDTKYSGTAVVEVTSESGPTMQKVTVTFEDQKFDVITSVSNGSVLGIEVDSDFASLLVAVETSETEDGELTITLPRVLIDARTNGDDDEFIVVVDGDEVAYNEDRTTEMERVLTIPVFAASEEVEIIGTQAIPEFPVNLAVITAVGLIGVLTAMRLKANKITLK